MYHVNINRKRAHVAKLLPGKIIFKARSMMTKKEYFIKIKYSYVLLYNGDTSEKCDVGRFHCCANITEVIYTDLNGMA